MLTKDSISDATKAELVSTQPKKPYTEEYKT